MMDERKLKSAFSKVKGEMSILEENVAKLQMQVAQSVRDSGSSSNSSLVDSVKSMEVELNSVKHLVATLSKLVEQNTNDVKEIKSELKELKEDLDCGLSGEVSNKNNISLVNSKLADFQELINGKLTLEIAELRVEFTEEIANVFDNMTKGLEKIEKKTDEKMGDIKVTKKEKILEKDDKILASNQKTLIEEVEYTEQDEKPSRFKKAIKWLFVDEDEDDLESLKKDKTADDKKDSNSRK